MKKKFLNMISDNTYYFKKIFYNKSFYIGLIISFFLLFFSLRNFDSNKLLNAIENVNFFYLLLASLLLMIAVYLRGLRWGYLIQNDNINSNELYKGQLIGYFINNIFPLRVGEIAKAYYIGNKFNQSKSFIFGTVVLERLFDFVGLIFLLLILSNSYLINIIINNFVYGLAILLILSSVGTIIIYILKIKTFKIFIKTKFNKLFINIIDGCSILKNKNIPTVIILTILIWTLYILEVYLVQSAFSLNLNIQETIFILFISSLAMILPAIPGNFGTFEGSITYSLALLNHIDDFGFSFILHLVSYIPYTIFGFIYFMNDIEILFKKSK